MQSRLLIRSCFANVQGLREGAEVRFAGVQIGFVKSIRARPDDKQCPAAVEMAIGPGYELRIPRDSTVAVGSAGLLGASVLDIDARNASGTPIVNYGTLSSRSVPTVSAEDVVKTLSKSLGRCPCNDEAPQMSGKDPKKP